MFFDFILLKKSNSNFAIPWTVATRGVNHVLKSDILKVDISKFCEAFTTFQRSDSHIPRERFSLRLSITLIHGASLILQYQSKILLAEITDSYAKAYRLVFIPSTLRPLESPIPAKSKKSRKRPRTIVQESPEILTDEMARICMNIFQPEMPVVAEPEFVVQPSDLTVLREAAPQTRSSEIVSDKIFEFGALSVEEESQILGLHKPGPVREQPAEIPMEVTPLVQPQLPQDKTIVESQLLQEPAVEEVQMPEVVPQQPTTLIPEPEQREAVEEVQMTEVVPQPPTTSIPEPEQRPVPQVEESVTRRAAKRKHSLSLEDRENKKLVRLKRKMFLKIPQRALKKPATAKPELKPLPGPSPPTVTVFYNFKTEIKQFLDKYLVGEAVLTVAQEEEVPQRPQIVVTPPPEVVQTEIDYENLRGRRKSRPEIQSPDITFSRTLRPFAERAAQGESPQIAPFLGTPDKAVPEIPQQSAPEIIQSPLPEVEQIRTRSPVEKTLSFSPKDNKERQAIIIKKITSKPANTKFSIEELAMQPPNKKNIAVCFSDLLVLSWSRYVNLHHGNNCELEYIERGTKLLEK